MKKKMIKMLLGKFLIFLLIQRILEENMNLLGSKYSFEDYARFYDEHFAPMQIPEELRLDDGTVIRGEDEVEISEEDRRSDEEEEQQEEEEDDFPFGF